MKISTLFSKILAGWRKSEKAVPEDKPKTKFTLFWDEGMSDEERAYRAFRLFDSLERRLVDISGPTDLPAARTYIFVPGPPSFSSDLLVGIADTRYIAWGFKGRGRAAATGNLQAAQAIAPDMLNIWADPLSIFTFAAELPDDATLRCWIEEEQGIESDVPPGNKMQAPPLPPYALMVFDCGDLIGEVPTEWSDLIREPTIEI